MAGDWERGSEWRKWELHLHSPSTKLADAYQIEGGQDVWVEYCRRLHESDVHVFGITDYFSADGYFETIKQYRSLYGDCKKLFIPNVELRTNEVVNKGGEHVHVHLLFNPSNASFDSDIRKFIGFLETSKTASGSRRVFASELRNKSDFEEATVARDAISAALEKTYGPQADLTDFVLLFTSANNDGIRADSRGGGAKRKALISDELDKMSQGFFGSTRNVEYFLSKDRYEDAGLNSKPKPTVSGCDAHSFLDLEKRLGKVVHDEKLGITFQPTWIKADLTFEGLKQILYEPGKRVFIGDEPEVEKRLKAHKNKYIESLLITSVDGYTGSCGTWFQDKRIPFGKELVAIIGNKGSGKSAVADIIGLLGNTHNQRVAGRQEELFSFLTREKFRKNKCAANFRAELRWHDGQDDKSQLDADVSIALPERVEYLPQKYLERVCADIEDDGFRTTLNDVIFGYVKEEDRYGQQNFTDLINYLTEQQSDDIERRKDNLHFANETVVAIERKLAKDYETEVEGKIANKERDLQVHRGTKPFEKIKPDSGAPGALADIAEVEALSAGIEELIKKEADLKQEQIDLKKSIGELKRVRQEIQRGVLELTDLKKTHDLILSDASLSFDQIVMVSVHYQLLDAVITVREDRSKKVAGLTASQEEIESWGGEPAQQEEQIRASLVCQRLELEQKKATLMERLGAPEREYREYLDANATWKAQEMVLLGEEDKPPPESLRGLQKELQNIAVLYPQQLDTAKFNRDAIAKDIFKKKFELTAFYNSVKAFIDAEIEKYRDDLGDYDVAIEAGLRFSPDFYEAFLKNINQNVRGTFHGSEPGRTALKGIAESVSSWESEQEVFRALNTIVDALHFDRRVDYANKDMPTDVLRQAKNGQTLVELYDLLYRFDYLNTKYDLMVDGKDLSELSPGERGGLLMIFYLMLDRRDIPLVIDQPEDNLDNESVYKILAAFLKKAKTRRQIIMVTHNPNLAVGADAEQIIRVSINKKLGSNEFRFYAGSIENPRMNAAVVDILEGTLPAFDKRRLKYPRQ